MMKMFLLSTAFYLTKNGKTGRGVNMIDFIGTLFMLGIGVFIGAIGMRVIWLMSIEDNAESVEE